MGGDEERSKREEMTEMGGVSSGREVREKKNEERQKRKGRYLKM